ncbi:MAG: peptidoglycan DD-metalloendopeptidase family protein [Enterococcus sp.]
MRYVSKLLTGILILSQLVMAAPLSAFAEERNTGDSVSLVDLTDEGGTSNSALDEPDREEDTTNSSEESSELESSSQDETVSTEDSGSTETSDTSMPPESSEEAPNPDVPEKNNPSISNEEQADAGESNNEEPTITNEGSTPSINQNSEQQYYIPTEYDYSGIVGSVSNEQQNDDSLHFEKNLSTEAFIKKIGDSARKIGQEKNLYASVMIAQAILESGGGSSELSQAPFYNLFGIKGSYEGKSIEFETQEDNGSGTLYSTAAGFRVYENFEASLNDYAELLTKGLSGDPDFYKGALKSDAGDYKAATKYLTGRYATDTQYHVKLDSLIETYDLTEYDHAEKMPDISNQGYIQPVKNFSISSNFGNRSGEFHRGLDLAAPQGEPIMASKSGVVLVAEYHHSWGNYVVIKHDDGMTSLYAHQSEYTVKPGDKVTQGQTIGFVGSTGNSTGSHLHLEICQDDSLSQDKLMNPFELLF